MTSTEPTAVSLQLHEGNPTAGYVSRVLLKDEQGYNRAVLAVGQECPNADAAHESAIRTYQAAARKVVAS